MASRAPAAVAVLAVLVALPGCTKPAPEETVPAVLAVKVRAARVETLKDTLVAPGTVVPAPAADLMVVAPEVCEIVELPLPEGASVKAGDVLVRFDIASISADVSEKQNAVEEATIRVNGAKAELARQSALFAQAVIPKNAVDAAKSALAAAEAALAHAQQLLKTTSALAARSVVRAPFAGTLVKVYHSAGETVRPSADDPVLRLLDPTRVQIAVRVTAGQLIRITPGQDAFLMDPIQGTSAPATVAARPVLSDQAATSAEIRIAPAGPTTLALDAMVQVEVVLDVREGVIAVPTTAIQRTDATPYVMIAGSDGKAHRREVQLGLAAGALTQIMAGVAAGDQIIVSPLEQVTDGMAIEIEK